MTALRVAVILSWLAVLVVMAPSVLSIYRGRPRNGDPARLLCFGYAFTTILFAGRWFIAPDDVEVWAALYVLSAVLAFWTLITARSYGRGPRV